MQLLGAAVLLVLGVFPSFVYDPLDAGNAGDTFVSFILLGVAVLILVVSLRGDAARWYRVASSVVATAAALLWFNWSGFAALQWSAGL